MKANPLILLCVAVLLVSTIALTALVVSSATDPDQPIQVALASEADYAGMVPAPDTVVLREGESEVLWLTTNRHQVELRVEDSAALAFGGLQRQDPVMALGTGPGCLATVPDDTEAAISLPAGVGLTVIGCQEAADVVMTLHGDDGADLHRYDIDVLPALVNHPPVFQDGGYTSRRLCVDDPTDRGSYLTGDELAGAAVAATDADPGATITYALGLDDPAGHYLYLEVVATSGQLTVNDAGANDTSGLAACPRINVLNDNRL